jgi:hypothetical protein
MSKNKEKGKKNKKLKMGKIHDLETIRILVVVPGDSQSYDNYDAEQKKADDITAAYFRGEDAPYGITAVLEFAAQPQQGPDNQDAGKPFWLLQLNDGWRTDGWRTRLSEPIISPRDEPPLKHAIELINDLRRALNEGRDSYTDTDQGPQ